MSESHRMNQGRVNPEPPCPGPLRSPPHTVPHFQPSSSFLLALEGRKKIFLSKEEWRRSPLSNYLAHDSCLYTMTNHNEATPLPLSVEKNHFFIRRLGAAVKNLLLKKSSEKEAQGQPF